MLTRSLQYLTITHPDISFAINHLCQHMHTPTVGHHQLLKRLLRYIKGTLDFGLCITSSSLVLTSYSDSDWASDPADHRSITEYSSFLGLVLISRSTKKQQTVARSSAEAEYRALLPPPHRIPFGFVTYHNIFMFLYPILKCSIVITLSQSLSPTILFFMLVPSILKLISFYCL